MKKFIFVASVLSALTLTACGGSNTSSSVEPEEETVNVFVLSGQSNMEGNTSWNNNNIENAFTDLGLDDVNVVKDGMPEVLTSYYGCGYGQLPKHKEGVIDNYNGPHASNKENGIMGQFLPTKVGMGASDNQMGPELGCAYKLREHASEDEPIYFIKMSSSGSGFAQSGTDYNWPVKDATTGEFPEVNLYHTFLKPFMENNLHTIEEETGKKPIIRGWLWHQGESDTATEKIAAYAQRLGDMINLFRSDFESYAEDEDGTNIAFIDGMIYQGSGTQWGAQTSDDMNNVKKAFAESDEVPNTYIVDNYGNLDPVAGNELKPGNPGGDSMHYCTKDSFRLGMGYADVIIENNLLGE